MTSSSGLAIGFDGRDQLARSNLHISRSSENASAVTLHHPLPARNQGNNVNCCVSVTLASCMEILDAQVPGNGFTPLSVLFHYFVARRLAGVPVSNTKADLLFQQGLSAVIRTGICARSFHPVALNPANARRKPSPQAISDAEERRIARDPFGRWKYKRISAANLAKPWRKFLLSRVPIAMGIWVTDGYQTISKTSPMHGPPRTRGTTAHAATVIGFNDKKLDWERRSTGAFLIKDSRGTGFGRKGHWWLPYRLMKSGIIYDSWIVGAIDY